MKIMMTVETLVIPILLVDADPVVRLLGAMTGVGALGDGAGGNVAGIGTAVGVEIVLVLSACPGCQLPWHTPH